MSDSLAGHWGRSLSLTRVSYAGSARSSATCAGKPSRGHRSRGHVDRFRCHKGSGKARGVVIGHSIGGAITVSIAARNPSWPLLGIAVSGVGLETPRESGAQWAALPRVPMIELPPAMKDMVMFGPDWTVAAPIPALGHESDAPVPRQEVIDITSTWHSAVRGLAAKVKVPVHYRQAEFRPAMDRERRTDRRVGRRLHELPAGRRGDVQRCGPLHRFRPAWRGVSSRTIAKANDIAPSFCAFVCRVEVLVDSKIVLDGDDRHQPGIDARHMPFNRERVAMANAAGMDLDQELAGPA